MGVVGNALSSVGDLVGDGVKAVSSITSPEASLLTGGTSLLGGLLTNSANASQAEQQEGFQEDMSNTSYQRGVKDMEAAGINPMLAATNGGASTPTGASATFHDPVTPAVNSAMSMASTQADLDQTRATIDNLHATNDQIKSQTALNKATSAATVTSAAKTAADLPESRFWSDVYSTVGDAAHAILHPDINNVFRGASSDSTSLNQLGNSARSVSSSHDSSF